MVTVVQTLEQLLHRIFQAKAATLTIAQGFSLAYQSWQAGQVPARRVREVVDNVVVTQAVVEKQPVDPDEPITSIGE